MKKCPGCGSFSSDEETACGVCGANLSDTSPIEDTMEAIDLKDQAVRQSQDRKEAKAQLHRIAVRATIGLTVGLGVLVFCSYRHYRKRFWNSDGSLPELLPHPPGTLDRCICTAWRTGVQLVQRILTLPRGWLAARENRTGAPGGRGRTGNLLSS